MKLISELRHERGAPSSNLLPVDSITKFSVWLILLKLLQVNTWSRVDPTGGGLLTCGRVVAAIWLIYGPSNNTAILWDASKKYGKITFLISIYFTGYMSIRSRVTRSVS